MAIVRWIAENTATLTESTTQAEREISLLRENRTTLTADVVTGKLDVRSAASRLPDAVADLPPDPTDEPEDAEIDEGESE